MTEKHGDNIRIYPNKSPINLIPFHTAIHHARENNAQLISTEKLFIAIKIIHLSVNL
jgi:hypothetical protein